VPSTPRTHLKYYTFTAAGRDGARDQWFFAATIDEEALVTTLGYLLGSAAGLSRVDTYMMAISIIHRKAKDLLKTHTGAGEFRFSAFETREIEKSPGVPGYQAGGLAIWMLSGPFHSAPLT
jgi:hypothetical protein